MGFFTKEEKIREIEERGAKFFNNKIIALLAAQVAESGEALDGISSQYTVANKDNHPERKMDRIFATDTMTYIPRVMTRACEAHVKNLENAILRLKLTTALIWNHPLETVTILTEIKTMKKKGAGWSHSPLLFIAEQNLVFAGSTPIETTRVVPFET
jgi:hypothetical protein